MTRFDITSKNKKEKKKRLGLILNLLIKFEELSFDPY